MKTFHFTTAIAVFFGIGFIKIASADLILSPTSVVSNSMGSFSTALDVGNVIDRSGLSAGFTSGVTNYSTYIAMAPTHMSGLIPNISWQSASGNTTGNLVFDLGDIYNIERLAIWQGGSASIIGSSVQVHGITLETSEDIAFSSSTNVGSFNVPRQQGVSAYSVRDFDLTDSFGRYVRLTIDSNHGGPPHKLRRDRVRSHPLCNSRAEFGGMFWFAFGWFWFSAQENDSLLNRKRWPLVRLYILHKACSGEGTKQILF